MVFRFNLDLDTATSDFRVRTIGDAIAFSVDGDSPANALIIDNLGEVGIGTSSPGALLHVSGDVRIDDGTTAADTLTFDDDFANPVALSNKIVLHSGGYGFGVSGGDLDIQTDRNIRFYELVGTTPTERMVIEEGGDVGIGTNSPSSVLHIVDTTNMPSPPSHTSNVAFKISNAAPPTVAI